jgi:hypothetical protein
MMRFSIFLGKIGRGFVYKKKKKEGVLCTPNMYKRESGGRSPRQLLWFLEEKLLGILVFIGSMILMNLLCFFAR